MKKNIYVLILLILTVFSVNGQQLAFPGAEGYGKYVTGGRGGTVIEVTNLNATGTGSFGAAIAASGARTIVFRVSGTITGNFSISNGNLTIAGQTAPGDGICIRGNLSTEKANNIIIRYIRVRFDPANGASDAIGGRFSKDIIFDHVSASWSTDETMTLYHCENTTVQWCMISEACEKFENGVGIGHRFGGIWGNNPGTWHHNLIAHNDSRNPRWASGCGLNDYRNNVIYNWGYQSSYGGERRQNDADSVKYNFSTVNMIANYYKAGPATGSGVKSRIVEPSARSTATFTDYGSWCISGNYVDGYPAVTADNWTGVYGTKYVKLNTPWPAMAIEQQTVQNAYNSVLDNTGCSLKRDAVDSRIIGEVISGTATYGNNGIITTPADVGGWPALASTTAPVDTDHDGMPDAWENAHSLNPSGATDRNTVAADGYTMLEKYLNSIEFNYAVSGYVLSKQANGSIIIKWRDSYLAEEGFTVEKSLNGVTFFPLAEELPKNSNTYTDNNPGSYARIYYRVIAYNSENTTPATSTVIYDANTAINMILLNKSIKCSPNPFENKLRFEIFGFETGLAEVDLYDLTGHAVASSGSLQVNDGNIEWTNEALLSSVQPGLYIGVIKSGDQILGNVKLTKIR